MSAALKGPALADLGQRKLVVSDYPVAREAQEHWGCGQIWLLVGCEMDWVVNGSDYE